LLSARFFSPGGIQTESTVPRHRRYEQRHHSFWTGQAFQGAESGKIGQAEGVLFQGLLLLQFGNPSWISILTGKRPQLPDFFNSNETIKGYKRHPRGVHRLVSGKIDADSFTINPNFRLLPGK
jgi:hypothetical protein